MPDRVTDMNGKCSNSVEWHGATDSSDFAYVYTPDGIVVVHRQYGPTWKTPATILNACRDGKLHARRIEGKAYELPYCTTLAARFAASIRNKP